MKKTFIWGLLAAALGFTACNNQDDVLGENTQKGMVLNATVEQPAETRATIDNSTATWTFAFAADDQVKVTNSESELKSYYTFTNDGTKFVSKDAKPSASPTTWVACYPSESVSLADQDGTIGDVAKHYYLLGSTSQAVTGADGLNITLKPTVAVLVIDNQKGDIDINVTLENGKWVNTMVNGTCGEASETKVSLLKTSVIGKHYIVVPAKVTPDTNLPLHIYDGDTEIKSTTTGLTAGCYYDLTVAEAPVWTKTLSNSMVEAYDQCTKIVIELGKKKPASGAVDLNDDGTVWGIYNHGTKTVSVQSSSPYPIKIATKEMFKSCTSVKTIEGLGNTVIGTDNLAGMFQNCKNLTSLDLSSFDTKNVTNFAEMFQWCEKLTSLDLSNFDTKKVENFAYMFQNCKKLTSLNLSSFDTSNADNLTYMFNNCILLETLTLSNNIKFKSEANIYCIFWTLGAALGSKKCTIKGVTDDSIKALLKSAGSWNDYCMQFE